MPPRPDGSQSASDQDISDHDTAVRPVLRVHPASVPIPQTSPPPAPTEAPILPPDASPIAAPRSDPAGGLTTYLGAPTQAGRVASVARAAQDRAQADVASVARSLADIAGALHNHAAALEPFVEGSFSRDLADPRMQALSTSLSIARQADLHLARLGAILRRLGESVQTARSNLDALQHERERLTSLYAVAQQLNSTLDLEDVLGRVMAELIEVVRAERGFLMLWDEAASALRFRAARGADGRPLREADFNLVSISSGVVQGVWESQQPLLTLDAQSDARLAERVSVVAYGIRSVMCAPLRVRGRGVGVVYVDSRSNVALFDAAALDLLAAFCNQAAIALDNARLFADLRTRIREISAMKAYTDSIFASIASGVITADTRGAVTAFNRAAERIFGVTGAAALGRPYADVLAGSAGAGDLAEISDILRRAIAEQRVTLGHELTRRVPGRGEVSLRLNVSPLQATDQDDPAGSGAARGTAEPLGVAMVVDDLTELRRSQRQAEQIQQLFGRYVHPAVVRQLLADPSAVHLGGETREISVIFADIRGYTRLAEQHDPADLVRILNSYLDILTEAVWGQEGTVTMFIGDALMAIFNAPLPQPDHALRAIRAAWAMRTALACRNGSSANPLLTSLNQHDQVEYGIGVHTGLAVVGNIGARDRLQNYTAIGDAVNTAQRLQAGASANTILLSAATYLEVVPHVLASELAPMTLKGKTRPLSVYQLDGLRS
jgi:PAS domain S-box-containing protein